MGGELFASQVDVHEAKAVPPVVVDVRAVFVYFADDQVSTEQIVDHQGSDAALIARGIAGVPFSLTLGRPRLVAPALTYRALDVGKGVGGHEANVPRSTDNLADKPRTPPDPAPLDDRGRVRWSW